MKQIINTNVFTEKTCYSHFSSMEESCSAEAQTLQKHS